MAFITIYSQNLESNNMVIMVHVKNKQIKKICMQALTFSTEVSHETD